MIVETYVEGIEILEREISLDVFYNRVNNFIAEGEFDWVKISSITPVNKGVSFTFSNTVSMKYFRIVDFLEAIVLEFEAFRNVITVNKDANVYLDLRNKRIVFKDFGVSLYFM